MKDGYQQLRSEEHTLGGFSQPPPEEYVVDFPELQTNEPVVAIELPPNGLLAEWTTPTYHGEVYTCFYGFMLVYCLGGLIWEGLSNLCISGDTCKDNNGNRNIMYFALDLAATLVFCAEVVCRFFADTSAFFRAGVNAFDACVLLASVVCNTLECFVPLPFAVFLVKWALFGFRYGLQCSRVIYVLNRRKVAEKLPVVFPKSAGSGPPSRAMTPVNAAARGSLPVTMRVTSPRQSPLSQTHSPHSSAAGRTNVFPMPEEKSPLMPEQAGLGRRYASFGSLEPLGGDEPAPSGSEHQPSFTQINMFRSFPISDEPAEADSRRKK